jgi:hypothetical protein
MGEEPEELGEWQKKRLNRETERRNGWNGIMRKPAELEERQMKRLNWENDRSNCCTGRMTQETAEVGEWQKKRLNWENERKPCWNGRLTEETAEVGEWQETAELREWKRKWLHTNLRPDREGRSIKRRDRIYVSYTKQTYYSNWRASRHLAGFRQVPREASGTQGLCSFIYIDHSASYLWSPRRHQTASHSD